MVTMATAQLKALLDEAELTKDEWLHLISVAVVGYARAGGDVAVTDEFAGQLAIHLDETEPEDERLDPDFLAMVDAAYKCLDCGVNTTDIEEYYMVHKHVWQEANPVIDGMLCIGCLERRIGRRLRPYDFTDCPLNMVPEQPRSKRLARRLGLIAQCDPDLFLIPV